MTWIVDTEIINPWGLCLGENVPNTNYKPYATVNFNSATSGISSYQGLRDTSSRPVQTHSLGLNFQWLISDYVRRTYDLAETDLAHTRGSWRVGGNNSAGETLEFDTEEEARAYADNLGPPPAMLTLEDGDLISEVQVEQYIDGVRIGRDIEIRHSGDTVVFYVFRDWVNYLATLLELDGSDYIDNEMLNSYTYRPDDWVNSNDDIRSGGGFMDWQNNPQNFYDYYPGDDCTPSRRIKIIELNGGLEEVIEVGLDYTPIPAPTDVTITVVDGDPPATMLENGPGSVTIHDNGNIVMLNDGGTFFLNEFGNVGFYANGDASLTADNQVQLGVGQNSVTVENGSLTIRDETGSATLTAEDINRLKETLT